MYNHTTSLNIAVHTANPLQACEAVNPPLRRRPTRHASPEEHEPATRSCARGWTSLENKTARLPGDGGSSRASRRKSRDYAGEQLPSPSMSASSERCHQDNYHRIERVLTVRFASPSPPADPVAQACRVEFRQRPATHHVPKAAYAPEKIEIV